MIKVTVGIPHYRDRRSLFRLLSAIDDQIILSLGKNDVEVIIVNDDDNEKVHKDDIALKNFRFKVFNEKHAGVAHARNKVISSALGKYIFFLDSDCIPRKDWLERLYDFLLMNNCDAAGGSVEPFGVPSNMVGLYYHETNILRTPIFNSANRELIAIVTANSGYKSDALRSIGGFNEALYYSLPPGGEDIELSYRLIMNNFRLSFAPDAIVEHAYPSEFRSIPRKFYNYGRGMRIHCIGNNIDPVSIRQPKISMGGVFVYLLKSIRKTHTAYEVFRKKFSLGSSIVLGFLELVRHLSFGTGFFMGPPK